MLQIFKLRDDPVLDFAAAELKKYLRMMMPEEKVVAIVCEDEFVLLQKKIGCAMQTIIRGRGRADRPL